MPLSFAGRPCGTCTGATPLGKGERGAYPSRIQRRNRDCTSAGLIHPFIQASERYFAATFTFAGMKQNNVPKSCDFLLDPAWPSFPS